MKIAFTILSPNVSGAEKRVIKLAFSDVFPMSFNNVLIVNESLYKGALTDTELSSIIATNRTKVLIVPDFFTRHKLLSLLFLLYYKLRYNIDIFHCYLYATSIGMFLAPFNIKVVYEVTSPDSAKKFIRKNFLWKFTFNRIFRINCVSKTVYDVLTHEISKNNYFFKAPIVFSTTPYTSVSLNYPVNIEEKQNIIVYACRFIDRKNVVRFSKVAKELLTLYPDWQVKIFGSGKLEPVIRGILSEELSCGRVFIGYTNNMIEELSKSKIIVSYIEPDNYPSQSLFEGLACSNAIVVSDTGNSRIYVANNNGFLSNKTFSLPAYVRDIEKLILDSELLRDMQINSRIYYENAFTEEKYIQEVIRNCYLDQFSEL